MLKDEELRGTNEYEELRKTPGPHNKWYGGGCWFHVRTRNRAAGRDVVTVRDLGTGGGSSVEQHTQKRTAESSSCAYCAARDRSV